MPTVDPVHQLTRSFATDDLREFAGGDGPFATVIVPSPSEHGDSGHRLEIRWRNARSELAHQWPAELLTALDEVVAGITHAAGEAIAVLQRSDGVVVVEALAVGVSDRRTVVGPHPRLATILENRQRTMPHIIVDTDRAGATITAFDGGAVVAHDEVHGDTEHIHRGQPGGWSQRRFQQRAENTWEQNADDVAEAVVALARRVDPVLTVVAGDVRARHLVGDALDTPVVGRLELLDSGSADAIADQTLRLLADEHARLVAAILDQLRAGGAITDPDEVEQAAVAGRVAALMVHDDDQHPDDDARIDRTVVAALASDARIVVLPKTAEMSGGLAALTRW